MMRKNKPIFKSSVSFFIGSEAYLEFSQTSKMVFLANVVNGIKS